jgi:hypothetical protein
MYPQPPPAIERRATKTPRDQRFRDTFLTLPRAFVPTSCLFSYLLLEQRVSERDERRVGFVSPHVVAPHPVHAAHHLGGRRFVLHQRVVRRGLQQGVSSNRWATRTQPAKFRGGGLTWGET